MFSNSLDRILKKIIQQPEWDNYRAYRQIIQCWNQVVNRKTLNNTRLISFERKTLHVATSSAVWAQELALQRYSLIKRLNSKLDFSIKDIRFSPARWHNESKPEIIEVPLQEVNLQKLRSEKNKHQIVEKNNNSDANIAVKKWLKKIQEKSDNFKICPHCQSLTPQAELTRWQLCRHCIAQKWDREYRPLKRKE